MDIFHLHHSQKPKPTPAPTPTPEPEQPIRTWNLPMPTLDPVVEPEPKEVTTMATATMPVPAPHESLGQKIVDVEKKFISILDVVAQDGEKALAFLDKYALPVAGLVTLIFPAAAPEASAAATAIDLIQKTVLYVKAKSALLPKGLTPAEMLADELQLVGPAVINLLAQEKIKVNSDQVENIIQAVVAILNTQPVPA